MLHLYDPEMAKSAREDGRATWMSDAAKKNPHTVGSFYGYCWQAGYAQDVRSIEELHRDWTKQPSA